MPVLIKLSQNIQSTAVYFLWSCIAADQSGCPCWPLSTAESTNNGKVSIRTGPQSNGRRWPGLIIMFPSGSMCVAYLGDALWEEGKPVGAEGFFEQSSAGKPWVVPFMWILLWYVPPTLTLLLTMYTFITFVLPDGCGLFQRDNAPCHTAKVVQDWLEKHTFKVLTWPANPPHFRPTFQTYLTT